jgi:hypothetical protein
MKENELRLGNLLMWDDESEEIIIVKGISPNEDYENQIWVDYSDFVKESIYSSPIDEFKTIPLTEKWLLQLEGYTFIPDGDRWLNGILIPFWIKSIHELQNWYYWNNNKKELEFETEKL